MCYNSCVVLVLLDLQVLSKLGATVYEGRKKVRWRVFLFNCIKCCVTH